MNYNISIGYDSLQRSTLDETVQASQERIQGVGHNGAHNGYVYVYVFNVYTQGATVDDYTGLGDRIDLIYSPCFFFW